MKPLLSLLSIFCFLMASTAIGQNKRAWMTEVMKSAKYDYSHALIFIDSQAATKEQLLNVKNTETGKVELWAKQKASKRSGLKEDREAQVIVTTQPFIPFDYPTAIAIDSSEYYLAGSDTVFVKTRHHASFDADTSFRPWIKFLEKNLNASVTAENAAPPGIYITTIRFIVNTDGSLSDLKIIKDPGYGTAGEVLKLMLASHNWIAATRSGRPVKNLMEQSITFQVAEE